MSIRDCRQSPFLFFLPAAGNRNNSNLNNAGSNGNYWSSELNTSNSNNARNLNFNSGNVNTNNNNNRYNGYSVRPVCALFSTYFTFLIASFYIILLCTISISHGINSSPIYTKHT